MTIGQKLAAARGDRSREQVAQAVGISTSAVSMYESGARVPRDEIKVRLAGYFGVSVQSLFFDDDVTVCVS